MHQDDLKLDQLIQTYEGAWRSGYAAFPALVHKMGLRRGVEVGVAFGGHSGAILERGGVDKLFGVDRYRHRGGYDDPMNLTQPLFDRLAQRVTQRMQPFGERFELIRKDSAEAAQDFDDHSLDFVYLDADHSEEGVWQDLCSWAVKVREGGLIAGHDYGHSDFPGVKRAVDRFFSRFGWSVREEGHGVWWVQRGELPISYITPCYNCATWVRDAAASVIEANLKPGDEYILVNDGSTDGTANMLDQISQSHHAVRVINHETNRGGSAARNTAVEAAKNPLIFCLDSDNFLVPGSVAPLVDHLLRTGADTAGFQTLRYFTDAAGPQQTTHELVFDDVVTDFARCLRTTSIPSASGNYLYTRQAWERASGYPSGAGALDAWGFGIRKCATGSTMVVLPGSYYHHRHEHNSYWTRHARDGSIDRDALEVLRPFFRLIQPRDVQYLLSERGQARWFSDLDRRPLRVIPSPTKIATQDQAGKPIIKPGLLGRLRSLIRPAA